MKKLLVRFFIIVVCMYLSLRLSGYRLGEGRALEEYYDSRIREESLFARESEIGRAINPHEGLQEEIQIKASKSVEGEKMVVFKIEALDLYRGVTFKCRLGLLYKVRPPENEIVSNINIMINTRSLNSEGETFLFVEKDDPSMKYVSVEKLNIYDFPSIIKSNEVSVDEKKRQSQY